MSSRSVPNDGAPTPADCEAHRFLVGRHLSQTMFDQIVSKARARGTTFETMLLQSGAVSTEAYFSALLQEMRRRVANSANEERAATLDAARMDEAINGLSRRYPMLAARDGLWRWQAVVLGAIVLAVIGAMAVSPRMVADAVLLVLGLLFLPAVILRCVAVTLLAGRDSAAASHTSPEDRHLPTYAVLVPLYREADVLPDLIAAMQAISYPADKLDVVFVCEADDIETLAAIRTVALPVFARVVLVPPAHPRTKPKALNYALHTVTSEYVTIFDAEDAPSPPQLRAAVAAFAAADRRLGCLQARLNTYNWSDSWLTRQFTLEYSALFDGLLPALQRFGLPIPLGGTSNHFPTRVLRSTGGWDAFNVTEDADLGVRLCRLGYRIEILRSTTWEEAPARLRPWLAQRTRWVKGWLQTYAVHMRQPRRLIADLGVYRFVGFQVVAGGMITTFLLHPLLYVAVATDLLTHSDAEAAGTTDVVLATLVVLALVNMLTGVLSAMGLAAAAVAGRGRAALILSLPTMPIYWLLISIAAYRAIWQLVLEARRPLQWEKTPHRARRRSEKVAGRP